MENPLLEVAGDGGIKTPGRFQAGMFLCVTAVYLAFMVSIKRLGALAVLMCLVLVGVSFQRGGNGFEATAADEGVAFGYTLGTWLGGERIQFQLAAECLEQAAVEIDCLAGYEKDVLAAIAVESKDVEARTGAKINFVFEGGVWGCSYSGDADGLELAVAEMYKRKTSITKSVLRARGCLLVSGASGGEVDYAARVTRYADAMAPVAESLQRPGESQRATVERVLAFLQAIPYDNLADIRTGYLPPAAMIAQNRGDCDTKAVALAAILSNYGIETVFVVSGMHMFAAVNIPPERDDTLVDVGGGSFVAVDPTGPKRLQVGVVAVPVASIKQNRVAYLSRL